MAQINKPSEYFNTKLYTGNGSTQSITGVNFQPDMVWTKIRDGVYDHNIFDVIRGVTKDIRPNTTNAEGTQSGGLTSFDSDGYSLGSWIPVNESSSSYVSWNWLANGSGSSNTDGSITSTVSANTTSGFSIVSYTGTGSNATVGHGLGSAPKMVIVKSTSAVGDWLVGHSGIGFTERILLNTTGAKVTDSTSWQDTAPSSSVFSIGTNGACNSSGVTYVAYCFAEKKGFSKFLSHIGNGSTDGTFIYTGFKPAWFLLKPASGGQWFVWDSKRSPINQVQKYLSPEANYAEGDSSGAAVDFLSNGIKIRNSDGGINQSGVTYITIAFAENPLVGTNGVPTTAR